MGLAKKDQTSLTASMRLFVLLVSAGTVASFRNQNEYWEVIRPAGPPPNEGFQVIQEPLPALVGGGGMAAIRPYNQIIEGPRKRSAIVIDKLMYALQRAIDGKERHSSKIDSFNSIPELQRRGNGDNRLYWRCYFNAVSCF